MKESLGYGLQLAGFLVVGTGLAVGVGAGEIGAELGLMFLGLGLFLGGRTLSGRASE